MQTISYNKRELMLPVTEVPVIKVDRFDVRQIAGEDGIVHSEVVPRNDESILDLPFRNFSMQSYNDTGEVARLSFISPKQTTSFDAIDRVTGDLSEITAKVDHEMLMKEIASSAGSPSQESSTSSEPQVK